MSKSRTEPSLARRVLELREQVERMERDKARLEGKQEQLLHRLREEHGCASLKEARKLQARKEREAARLEQEFGEALKSFQDKWGDKLEEGS